VNGIATPLGGERGRFTLAQRIVKAVHLPNLATLGHKATAMDRVCSTAVRASSAPLPRCRHPGRGIQGRPVPPLLSTPSPLHNPVTFARRSRLPAHLHAMKSIGSPPARLRSTPTRTPGSTDGPRLDPSATHGRSRNQWFIASGRASADASAMPLEPALWTPPFCHLW
jgi:hypothetical protein